MSRAIKITDDMKVSFLKDFEELLKSCKAADGKVSVSYSLGNTNRKAKVIFSELAWLKMQTLIREFDKEVAWHGVATRSADETKDEYLISDILVYPQVVTGASVNTDQKKYEMWLMSHENDVFNNIRMQGHSHVNMSTFPSTVDISHQERILEQVEDDMFYIFMIWNKRGDKNIKIYDMTKNTLFENQDITVEVLDDGTGIEHFLADAKKKVQNYVSTPAPAAKTPPAYTPPKQTQIPVYGNNTGKPSSVTPANTQKNDKKAKRIEIEDARRAREMEKRTSLYDYEMDDDRDIYGIYGRY